MHISMRKRILRVVIRNEVHNSIKSFYRASIELHPTLTREVVRAKEKRLYAAIRALKSTYNIYPKARLRRNWINAGYSEMICEDFHFAFKVEQMISGEQIVVVHDAVHSLLYRE